MYWTDIIRGEAIQILILKPNANEQVILSSLTFVTGLVKACLFWKTNCGVNQLLSQVPVFIHEQYANQSQVYEAMQYSLPKCQKTFDNISLQPMRFEYFIDAISYL